MESRHGQRECSWKIVAQATKVGGNEQGQPDGIQPLVCSVESRVSFLGQIKHETRLFDLHPVHPCMLPQLQYFFIIQQASISTVSSPLDRPPSSSPNRRD